MDFPKLKSSSILHDRFFVLREDLLEHTDGTIHPYMTLSCSDAVAVLAQDPFGRWILNREYRHASGKVLIGCPGGRLEENEEPLLGGKREFLEETGYQFEGGTIIGRCHPFPSVCNQQIYYIFGKNATKIQGQSLDPLERIEPILLSNEELKAEIKKGTPVDGILLTALWLKEHF